MPEEEVAMSFPRASGILLHPTSLPGRFGCGDLGPEAYRFLEFLVESKQRLWQVLPLGPTGYGDSPYQSFSAFAGNPLLISLDKLVEEHLLLPSDLEESPSFPKDRVDYGSVIEFKTALLKISFENFKAASRQDTRDRFEAFCRENSTWLDDFALFMALKEAHGGAVWNMWEPDIAGRQPEAMERWAQVLAGPVQRHKYLQYQFFKQWSALKQFANEQGISLIGDIPIFVAHDSADVWAHPELFYLDDEGTPTVVAGVPPDYFSRTGQLWGNPLYRWQVIKERGYTWWIDRVKATLATVDIIRLDHFRGFEAYWEVPATEETAVNGRWVKGPGADLFHALRVAFSTHNLPIIAEDLGVITPEVEAIRDHFEFPGMRVLQFAFDDGMTNLHTPYQYPRNCVVYTGTHDNDTSLGWFRNSGKPEETELALKYLGTEGREFHWDLIRLALSSVADTAIIPLQDALGLDSEARMNYPSKASGNWSWRYLPDALTVEIKERLAEMTEVYGRAGEVSEQSEEEVQA
jgi:4-alpha-glucanotransferase